jgi:FkbM family methyltransferase
MSTLSTLRWILSHPLNRGRGAQAIRRYLSWQFGSRLVPGPVAVPFAGQTRLLVAPGMTGATGNIYCGLHEFHDMAFVLHVLRPTDLFVDIGANVGTYSILAAGVASARCVSFEPHPGTFQHLLDNIRLNGIGDRVFPKNMAIGSGRSRLRFTANLDTVNHIVSSSERSNSTIEVEVDSLDSVLSEHDCPTVLKIDVEGFESEVIAGARTTLSSPSLLAVIMELNGSGARYGYTDEDLHCSMKDRGFEAASYEPFARRLVGRARGLPAEGNVLYVRDRAEVMARIESAPRFEILGKVL